jgi:hypothetical protein
MMRRPLPLLVALALTLALPAGCRSHRAGGDQVFHQFAPAYVVLGKNDFEVYPTERLIYLRPGAARKIVRYFGWPPGTEVMVSRLDP